MRPNQKKHLLNDIIIVIMLLAALLTIIRLWPLLLLLLIGLIAYALWVLFQLKTNLNLCSCCLRQCRNVR